MNDLIKQTVDAAREKGWRIATAESCTGGLISAALTEIAGSSDAFDRGYVTYSNNAKMEMLGVKAETLTAFGAVSEQVAAEMAVGALDRSGADISVSVTGIAGPGGSDHKPEGRVCFGWAVKNQNSFASTIEFGAMGRDKVRNKTVEHALELLIRIINSA
jgi:nicotinamide-nucleotide amidase